jgi:predicted 3-demethylubiquinone-9 3-methyltransferase (glyoxalase superfamily)
MNPKNNFPVNRAFEVQIQTLRQTETERLALQILQKKKQLETARDVDTIEQLYAESDALEWLQRGCKRFTIVIVLFEPIGLT